MKRRARNVEQFQGERKEVGANALTSALIAHNYPSGDSESSTADRMITARLKQALTLIELKLKDHLIVGKAITSIIQR